MAEIDSAETLSRIYLCQAEQQLRRSTLTTSKDKAITITTARVKILAVIIMQR